MANTTAIARLSSVTPESETHWREILAQVYRILGFPGADAWARTQDLEVSEIRKCHGIGSTRQPRLCPRCLARGARYHLIFVAGALGRAARKGAGARGTSSTR